MDTWAHRREYDDDRDDSEPPPALMRALSTQVVFLLGTRHEVMSEFVAKNLVACSMADCNSSKRVCAGGPQRCAIGASLRV